MRRKFNRINGLWTAILFIVLTLSYVLFASAWTHADTTNSQSATIEENASGANEPSAADAQPEEVEAGQTTAQEVEEPGVVDYLLSSKYIAFYILILAGLVLLFGKWINIWVRVLMMAVAFVLFGLDFFFPLHPSPMCGITKLFTFKFTQDVFFPIFVALFLVMVIPSLIGRKLFCGWVCPLGAFQELINRIPHKYKWKRFNFTAFNSIRMALLAVFFLTIFFVRDQIFALGEQAGADITSPVWQAYAAYSVYDPINFFELLHWGVDALFIIMMAILIIASLFLYRPFCYLVCPIGAVTWLCEKIAPGRIRVNMDKCTECGDCEEKSPCPTIYKLRDESVKAAPDCTSCGECITACKEGAIKFSFRKSD